MPANKIKQPEIIEITETLRLVKIDENQAEMALPWYQDREILYYSEGRSHQEDGYSLEVVRKMYKYLGKIGELYFIEVLEDDKWYPIGDVTLSEENMPIILGDKKYWGQGIGKKVISTLIDRAKDIGLEKIHIPTIYKYNDRSRNLFKSFGFVKVAENEKEESYQLELKY